MRSCQRQIRNQKRHLNQSLIKLCQKLCPRRRSLTSSILRGNFPSCRLLKMNGMFTTNRVRISTLLKMNGTFRKVPCNYTKLACFRVASFLSTPVQICIILIVNMRYFCDISINYFLYLHLTRILTFEFCVPLICLPAFPFLFDGLRKTAYWAPGLGFIMPTDSLFTILSMVAR